MIQFTVDQLLGSITLHDLADKENESVKMLNQLLVKNQIASREKV
jgi:hypothetical protein